MRIVTMLLIASSLVPANASAQSTDAEFKALYDGHHWFQLRDEQARKGGSSFYKAAVEVAFGPEPKAEADLKRVVSSANSDALSFEARELLIGLYFRLGKYREAFAQGKLMLSQKPDAADIRNMLPTLQVLSSFPDQTTVSTERSSIPIDIEDENLALPVHINGTEAHYILDNGFSISGMSELEAKRLHLTIHEVKTKIDTMSGAEVSIRVAVAENLQIGNTHLKNVAFYVLPVAQPPFNELAEGRQGILGLPVVIALNHFQWSAKDRMFRLLPPSSKSSKDSGNLAFDGTSIFQRAKYAGGPLDFSLDMGAQNTVLYPAFAQAHPDLQTSGSPEAHKVTGVGGSAEIPSVLVPFLDPIS
jgi:Aspartyl protease